MSKPHRLWQNETMKKTATSLFGSKPAIFILTIVVIGVVSLATLLFSPKSEKEYRPGISKEEDKAANQAQKLYQEKKKLGVDFNYGPCLTNDLMPGWVADIIHTPKNEIDLKVENQCQAYLEGRATHIVEMDKEGNIIKVE